MGLFDKIFGKKDASAASTVSANVQPVEDEAPVLTLDMSKHAANLDAALFDMSKASKVDMSKHTAQVVMFMDYSISMQGMFQDSTVQKTVTRLLPVALKFDDNGILESYLFSNGCEKLAPVTSANYLDYVNKIMVRARMRMGGTQYAPALKAILDEMVNNKIPTFVIFITDGDNQDKEYTNEVVRELSKHNVFVQFIGIGTGSDFKYLRNLDNLSGREHDNTGFIEVKDMNKMDDQQLYTEMLRQYIAWLNNK